MEPVGHNYRDQLCYAGEKQVGMKCSGVLRLTISETETVFEVIYGAFD